MMYTGVQERNYIITGLLHLTENTNGTYEYLKQVSPGQKSERTEEEGKLTREMK